MLELNQTAVYSTPAARQKPWRALGLVGLLIIAVVIGYTLERSWHFRGTKLWLNTAQARLSIIKTTRNSAEIEKRFHDVQLFNNTPWTITDVLGWSKREAAFYINNGEVIGVSLDQPLSESQVGELAAWDIQVYPTKNYTLLTTTEDFEIENRHSPLIYWGLLPYFNGTVAVANPNKATKTHLLPWRWTADGDLELWWPNTNSSADLPTPITANSTKQAQLYVEPEQANAWLPSELPLNFPSLNKFNENLKIQGFQLILGSDDLGPTFSITSTSDSFDSESSSELAKEVLSLINLSKQALPNTQSGEEIRFNSQLNAEVNHIDNRSVVTVTDNHKNVIQIQEDADFFSIANRSIESFGVSNEAKNECLNKSPNFIHPNILTNQLLEHGFMGEESLFGALER
jgi:hypothetical protein